MTNTTEAAKLRRELRREGFTVEPTGSSHWRIMRADMAGPVFASTSPRANGALHQVRKDIQRQIRRKADDRSRHHQRPPAFPQ